MEVQILALKLGLILFWEFWLLTAFLTNLFEGLKVIRVLPPSWRFASQNFQAIVRATAMYHAPAWLPRLLFIGVLLWQLLALTLLGWTIVCSFKAGSIDRGALNVAFGASVGLLGAFMIADEIFKEYDLERAHVLFFIAQVATLILLYVLPS